MLQPYRQFCLQRIESEHLAGVRERHARYFAQRAEQLGRGIYGENEVDAVKMLNSEWPDLRHAIAWGREHADPSIAIDPIVHLARTIIYHARSEAFAWLHESLRALPDQNPVRADIHWVSALGLWMKGDGERAYECLDLADSIQATPQSLWVRYILLFGDNRFSEATEAIENARALAREVGDSLEQRWLAQPYRAVPLLMMDASDSRVDDCVAASEAFLSKLDWPTADAYLQMVKGTIAMARQDPMTATEYMSKAVRLARSCGNRGMEMLAGLMSDGLSDRSTTPTERLASSIQQLQFLMEADGRSHLPLAMRSIVSSLVACGHIEDAVRCSAIVPSLKGVGDQDELSPGYAPMLKELRLLHDEDFQQWLIDGSDLTFADVVGIAEQHLSSK